MKKTAFLFIIIFAFNFGFSQSDYEIIKGMAQELREQGEFTQALEKYELAERLPNMTSTERKDLELQKQQTWAQIDSLIVRVRAEKEKVEKEKQKTQKIIDAFYFYDGKFAIAFKNDKYGFINKQGDIVIEYKYQDAQPFRRTNGLAKVKRNDTLGREYLLAEDINDLSNETKALDLSENNLTEISEEIFNYSQLEILLLHNNIFSELPPEIENLTNLSYLDISGKYYNRKKISALPLSFFKLTNLKHLNLSFCQLDSLPKEIGNLTNLIYLNLWDNCLI